MQHYYFLKNYRLTHLSSCITFAHLDSQSKGPGCCCFWKVLGSWGWGICSVIEAYLLCARLNPSIKDGGKVSLSHWIQFDSPSMAPPCG